MFYDYYGFPAAAYKITYPAPGSRCPGDSNRRLTEQESGLPAHIDPQRGFDHGLFIPLKLMYPQAESRASTLPVRGLDAAAHIALGKALRPLDPENVLVIGSGFSFHNMGAFAWQGTSAPIRPMTPFMTG